MIRFDLCPSLERLALLKIVTLLWTEDIAYKISIRDRIIQLPLSYFVGNPWFKTLEKCVFEKVTQLPIPEKLKDKLSEFIKPIEIEIKHWMKYDGMFYGLDLFKQCFRKIYWTPKGTINRKKTAEGIVKIQDLEVSSRYLLACTYCLEKYIQALWDQMPETQRDSLHKEYPKYVSISDPFNWLGLVCFWSSFMKGGTFRIKDMTENWPDYSSHQYMFKYAAVKGNKDAVEYLLKKLTTQERMQSVVEAAKHVAKLCDPFKFPGPYRGDVLCFLLSLVDERQQIDIIKVNPYGVLHCFLYWPLQNLFLDVANLVWTDILEQHLASLLNQMIFKTILGWEDYNYRELFGEFWHRSPSTLKKYVINIKRQGISILSNLLQIGDKKNIQMILKDATIADKKELILYYSDKWFCHQLQNDDVWNIYKIFVHECISDKNELVKHKDYMINRVSRVYNDSKSVMDKLKKFLDGFFKD